MANENKLVTLEDLGEAYTALYNRAIPTSSIVNDLTSGGTTAPLSAEMGKQLNTSLSNFRPNQLKRRWIFIGDSYGHASGTNNGWIDKLVTMMGLSSNDYYESGIGGAGFTTTSYGPFLNMITTLASNITDKNSITDIVVLGGANDLGQEASDVSAAIETFNTYCKSTFPNAKVYIGYISGCADPALVVPQYSRVKEGYSQCGTATYLHNLEYVFQNRAYLGSDKIHPTATGYTILTKKIYEALNGGCNVIYRDINVSLSYPAGSEGILSGQGATIIVNNGITDIWFTGRIQRHASQSGGYFNINNDHTICFVNTNLILPASPDLPGQYNPFYLQVLAKVHSTINNTDYKVNGYALLTTDGTTGKVKLSFIPVDLQLGQTSAFTSCDEIEIFGYHVSCASILC